MLLTMMFLMILIIMILIIMILINMIIHHYHDHDHRDEGDPCPSCAATGGEAVSLREALYGDETALSVGCLKGVWMVLLYIEYLPLVYLMTLGYFRHLTTRVYGCYSRVIMSDTYCIQ